MNGIINVYKEQGFTSHDVVAKLRGILQMKKIGHTGTLDPDAVGVLPVCLGKGTRLVDMITDCGKTYEAVMLLGKITDTQDISGTVLESRPVNVMEVDVMDACNSFIGEYDQIPPMYSAIKQNGHKLYELARKGIEVERKPRKVTIKSIHINDINLDEENKTVTFTVECSKGTYIRTLCQDIGERLGCGACMQKLTRTRVGQFGIDDSLTLNQISALCLKGEFEEHLIAVDEMFPAYRKLIVLDEFAKLLYNGNKFGINAVKQPEELQLLDMEMYRIYDEKNNFIGIYRYDSGLFSLVKMFYDSKEA
ncbi:MAG: tRNA pseudouridine(55) synthase TruB [Eubacteriales bacterium]|nr:tRNA pseudouridine(55) synthase TruB [Eubacteriales bacterium]